MVCVNCSTENYFSVSSETTQAVALSDESFSNRTSNSSSQNLENEVSLVEDEIAEWIWKVLSPIVLVVGLFGNILIILVMCRMKFWKKMTYFLLFILAISDIIVLCTGLIRQWVDAVFNFDIRNVSDSGCKFQVFMIYFSMHFSSWTLVNLTFERFLKTRDPFRQYCVDVSKILKFVYPLSIIITICIDAPLLATNGLMPSENGPVCTSTSEEYYTYEEKYFVFIDLAWISLLPFILMLIMNIFVGKTIHSSMRRRELHVRDENHRAHQVRTNRRLTRMLFWTSIYFLIATLPASINFVFDTFLVTITTPSEQTQANLALSTAILYSFQFTNYSVNFYIYIKCKPSFRRNLPFCLGRSSSISRRQRQTTTSRSYSNTLRTSIGNSMTIRDDPATATEKGHIELNSRLNGGFINNGHSNLNPYHMSHELDEEDLDSLVAGGQLHKTSIANHSIDKPLSSISSIAALVSGITIVSGNGEATSVSGFNKIQGNNGSTDTVLVSRMNIDTIVTYPVTESRDSILETTYL